METLLKPWKIPAPIQLNTIKVIAKGTGVLDSDPATINYTFENNTSHTISYIYDEDFTGKGYCTEACRKLVDVAFDALELNRIFADTYNAEQVVEKANSESNKQNFYTNLFGVWNNKEP